MPQHLSKNDRITMGTPPAWARPTADGTAMQYNPFRQGTVSDEWHTCQNWVALASDRGAWKRACVSGTVPISVTYDRLALPILMQDVHEGGGSRPLTTTPCTAVPWICDSVTLPRAALIEQPDGSHWESG